MLVNVGAEAGSCAVDRLLNLCEAQQLNGPTTKQTHSFLFVFKKYFIIFCIIYFYHIPPSPDPSQTLPTSLPIHLLLLSNRKNKQNKNQDEL